MNITDTIKTEIAKNNTCTLSVVGEENTYMHTDRIKGERTMYEETTFAPREYVMEGPTGRHTLQVAHTDRARLKAHWNGFCATNKEAETKFSLRGLSATKKRRFAY